MNGDNNFGNGNRLASNSNFEEKTDAETSLRSSDADPSGNHAEYGKKAQGMIDRQYGRQPQHHYRSVHAASQDNKKKVFGFGVIGIILIVGVVVFLTVTLFGKKTYKKDYTENLDVFEFLITSPNLEEANKRLGEAEYKLSTSSAGSRTIYTHSYIYNIRICGFDAELHGQIYSFTDETSLGAKPSSWISVVDIPEKEHDACSTGVTEYFNKKLGTPKSEKYEKHDAAVWESSSGGKITLVSISEDTIALVAEGSEDTSVKITDSEGGWFIKNGDFTFYTNGTTASIASYTGTDKVLTLPDSIKGMPVISVAWAAFSGNKETEEITVPDSVEILGVSAFQDCSALKKIILPDSITKIDINCFSKCVSLTEFTVTKKVEEIGISAFSGCTSLSSFKCDAENESFAEKGGALYTKDMSTLKFYPAGKQDADYSVDAATALIDDRAFEGNQYIKSIDLNNALEIGSYAFKDCYNLIEFFNNKQIKISSGAFENTFYEAKNGPAPNTAPARAKTTETASAN